ncbi:hypothetical protein AcV7_002445 [Taiwanofungus camphoratus]|nr:hypothetical protein AcV7_002445 [Antrodia cinnamomea]
MQDIVSPAASNTPYFTPDQDPPAGTAVDPQLDGKPIPKLFQPIKIRGVEFQNRIFFSPMAQYSADDGKVTPWHTAHIGSIAVMGPGLTFIEATSVLPEGRGSPQDTGLWSDEQIEPLRKLIEFVHSQKQKLGVQLGHSGCKASTVAKWLAPEDGASEAVGGWPNNVWGPSAISYKDSPEYAQAKALTEEGIQHVIRAFADAAERSVQAGIDVIEIHGAHGYLIHEFLSPITNKRTDKYGGSFDNRIRLAVEITDAVRDVIPETMPLFFRVSATDWLEDLKEPSWRCEDTVRLAEVLGRHGVDLLDVSSGGLDGRQKIKMISPAYQAHFAKAVKNNMGDKILVGAVGGISNGNIAQGVLDKGQADLVLVGRHFLKHHAAVWGFAEDLGVDIHLPIQVDWVFKGRGSAKCRLPLSSVTQD